MISAVVVLMIDRNKPLTGCAIDLKAVFYLVIHKRYTSTI
jgi:hypothetical protein